MKSGPGLVSVYKGAVTAHRKDRHKTCSGICLEEGGTCPFRTCIPAKALLAQSFPRRGELRRNRNVHVQKLVADHVRAHAEVLKLREMRFRCYEAKRASFTRRTSVIRHYRRVGFCRLYRPDPYMSPLDGPPCTSNWIKFGLAMRGIPVSQVESSFLGLLKGSKLAKMKTDWIWMDAHSPSNKRAECCSRNPIRKPEEGSRLRA